MKTKQRSLFAAVLAILVTFGVLTPAWANNVGTKSGVNTSGCAVSWDAKTIMSSALTNDDAQYPNLMVDLQGQPLDFTNGGYIQEVSPDLGDPGLLEVTHFYNGSGSNLTQVWRPVVATNFTILDAKLTFTLPEEVAHQPVTVDVASVNSSIVRWGGAYANYSWSPLPTSAVVDNGDGTYTVNLGTLDRKSGTVLQFNVALGSTTYTTADRFVASAHLSGTYALGTNGGQCPLTNQDRPPLPTVPDNGPCTLGYAGQTLWSVYDNDITERDKYYLTDSGVQKGDNLGEVNADGWGASADGWGTGATRTYRIYAATTKALTDVTWTIDAAQGVRFDTAKIDGFLTPGGGQLQNGGYTVAVTGATVVSATSTEIVVHIDSMPAMSSISFNVIGDVTGTSDLMVLNHTLSGTLAEECSTTPPPAQVVVSEWMDGDANCADGTVEQTRTSTTTPYVWSIDKLAWVLDTANAKVVTETQTRPMTDAEKGTCEVTTPPPTETPTPTPPTPTDNPTTPAPSQPGQNPGLATTGGGSPLGLLALGAGLAVTTAAAAAAARSANRRKK